MFCFEFLLFFWALLKFFCFTSMHLADAFIQSDLHCNCVPCFFFFVTHFSIHLFISLLTYSTITFWRLFILKSCYKNREKSDFCPSFKLIMLASIQQCMSVFQKRVVNVYRLITRGTLEEKIMGLQKFKITIANTVISQENASLQSMGTEQLLNLFTLDKVSCMHTKHHPMRQRCPKRWFSTWISAQTLI